jgi:glycosyltransferase involved in cell wall biosynthesis
MRLEEAATRIPELKIIKFATNAGKSDALDAGFRAARGDIIVTLDSDLQNPPEEIPRFVQALEGVDAVYGWRRNRQDTGLKRLVSRFANRFRRFFLDDDAHDSGCAFKAFRREVIDTITMYKGMHRFFPALIRMRGFSAREIRIPDDPRRHGKSKYGTLFRGFSTSFDLIAVIWMRRRRLTYKIEKVL